MKLTRRQLLAGTAAVAAAAALPAAPVRTAPLAVNPGSLSIAVFDGASWQTIGNDAPDSCLTIKWPDGSPLQACELVAGQVSTLSFDGEGWTVHSPGLPSL